MKSRSFSTYRLAGPGRLKAFRRLRFIFVTSVTRHLSPTPHGMMLSNDWSSADTGVRSRSDRGRLDASQFMISNPTLTVDRAKFLWF